MRSSLWFLPGVIVIGSCVLALGFIEIDYRVSRELLANYPRLFGAGAEGSRGMLSSIAGSMITVAGVTFSITIVALSQAANQYSSRLLRNFMRDRANQAVLGVFLGIFTYCLLVLRAIRGGDEGGFVPSLSVLGGVVMALVAIGFLIFFIHHAASSLQASNVVAAAATETVATIDRLFPDSLNADEGEEELDTEKEEYLANRRQVLIPAPKTGYIQSYDRESLVELAHSYNLTLRMHVAVGEFAVFDTPLVTAYSNGPLDEKFVENVHGAYTINALRTIEQDVGFGIRQIVDVALKALSTGMNDTTTALTCIDYLTAINVRLASRRLTPRYIFVDNALCLIAKTHTFENFVGESFEEIRANSRSNTVVLHRLIHALSAIAMSADNPARQFLIFRQIGYTKALLNEAGYSDPAPAKAREELG